MALLEDPTIQRILDEVNRAATTGIFGSAGNYTFDGAKSPAQMQLPKDAYYNQQQQQQQQAPLFYPTPDMFTMNGFTNFNPNLDLNAMAAVATPNSFDLYNSDLYNTMPQHAISPYENYGAEMLSHHQRSSMDAVRTMSSVSSTNNDILLDHHRHQEYSIVPPHLTAAVPNLGLNLRPSPTLESVPVHVEASQEEDVANERTDLATVSVDLLLDKEDNKPPSPTNNGDIDPPHISSAGRIFYDPDPQIIQRKGSNSVTYKQNIIVRFLQPPPIPNAGPLVIKEISSQQQQPLPPLVIKQRPSPPKTPPPLIIREKPPAPPSTLATKVITRHLPPEPAPPRAVVIERLPPLPPKPRDIIIERWLPYEIVNQKRKVVVERVQKTSKDLPPPKNVIITYEPVYAKIERHFQKQNAIREDPQAYVSRFGEELFEPADVIQQARAAGILEDLNPPSSFFSSTTNNVSIGTDYESTIKVNNEQEQEQTIECDPSERQEIVSPVMENIPDDDVLVEENVTPFYMNLGENLQQTFHRLGIDIPESIVNEHHF